LSNGHAVGRVVGVGRQRREKHDGMWNLYDHVFELVFRGVIYCHMGVGV
jgi:hypothetical protein